MRMDMDPLQQWFFSVRERKLPGYPHEFIYMTGHGRPDVTIADVVPEGLDPDFRLTWSEEWYGSAALRQRVLDTYQHAGLDIEHVLISHGTNAANYVAMQGLLEPGDEVVLQVPSWMQAYMVTTHVLRCQVTLLRTTPEDGWRIDLDRLRGLVSDRTRMIWIVSPSNPTGMVITEAEMQGVVDIARSSGAWVLHDAGHRGLEWDGGLAPAVVDLYERGVTTGGTTKALGVTGLRIGWIISRDKGLIRSCNTIQTYITLCTSWPGEALATRLLEPETFRRVIEGGKATGRRNRALFEAWLARHPERVGWVRPAGSYLGFPGYRYDVGSWDLCERALGQKVVLAPGAGFLTEGHFRIGFGLETPRFAEGLSRMDALLADLDGTGRQTP